MWQVTSRFTCITGVSSPFRGHNGLFISRDSFRHRCVIEKVQVPSVHVGMWWQLMSVKS